MITSVSSATDTTAAATTMKQTAGMNKDDFLQLFVTQLKNQDPLNPQDGTEFIGQLAQLTQVEQAYNANTNLQKLLDQGSNNMTLSALGFIGSEVQAAGSQVNLNAGTPSEISFSLAGPASAVTITMKDASGNTVKTLSAGAQGTGAHAATWDGTDSAGNPLPSGAYSFAVNAVDGSGTKVASTTYIKGIVDGVNMSSTTPTLNIGSIELPVYDVTSVKRSGA